MKENFLYQKSLYAFFITKLLKKTPKINTIKKGKTKHVKRKKQAEKSK